MRRFGLLLVVILLLAGCSAPFGSEEDPTVPAPASNVETDIGSGCWDAGKRTLAISDAQGGGSVPQWSEVPAMTIDPAKTYTATIVTNKGEFVITFFPGEAPIATNNFVCLARAGFYDGVIFHRIAKGFVIQGGDPTGKGSGGPGYEFQNEPVSRQYTRGIVAMANAGLDTNGSQFFVCLDNVGLQPNYTVFGVVTSGMETIDAIAAVPTTNPTGKENSAPTETVMMESVTISET